MASTSTSISDVGSTAGTVKAFRLFGVPVRLHFTFILLVVFVAVSVLGSNQSNASYAIFLLGGLVSVLLHELGHAVVAARFGIRTVEIVMFPIGGLSRMERSLKPAAEIWVSLAGPLVNVLLAAGIFAYMISVHEATPVSLADLLQPNGKSVLALALRWVLDQGQTIALWGARRPDQLDAIAQVTGWSLDEPAKREIDGILRDTITSPVGPEFMAPPQTTVESLVA